MIDQKSQYDREMLRLFAKSYTNQSRGQKFDTSKLSNFSITEEQKYSCFSKEIDMIKNAELKELVDEVVREYIPDAFFAVSASASGLYHPKCSLGFGGLVKHSKLLVRKALRLAGHPTLLDQNSSVDIKKDILIVASIIHDSMKYGESGKKYHPNHAMEIRGLIPQWVVNVYPSSYVNQILSCVESHAGLFDKQCRQPKNKLEYIFMLGDYQASDPELSSNKFQYVEANII